MHAFWKGVLTKNCNFDSYIFRVSYFRHSVCFITRKEECYNAISRDYGICYFDYDCIGTGWCHLDIMETEVS